MTAEQKQICEDLYRQLAEAGVEPGITISRPAPGVEDVREFPKVMSFQLLVKQPDGFGKRLQRRHRRPAPQPSGGGKYGW